LPTVTSRAAIAVVDPQISEPFTRSASAAPARDVLRNVLADLVRAFPDLLISVSRVITTGDVVTALSRSKGRRPPSIAGAINQGSTWTSIKAWRFVVGDGLITEVTAYWCQAKLYRRLAVKRYDEIASA